MYQGTQVSISVCQALLIKTLTGKYLTWTMKMCSKGTKRLLLMSYLDIALALMPGIGALLVILKSLFSSVILHLFLKEIIGAF
jgi:hypothetical protein